MAFFTEEIHRRFSVAVELKDSTDHTLEQETGGLVFKHETRFEMTKKAKRTSFRYCFKDEKRYSQK